MYACAPSACLMPSELWQGLCVPGKQIWVVCKNKNALKYWAIFSGPGNDSTECSSKHLFLWSLLNNKFINNYNIAEFFYISMSICMQIWNLYYVFIFIKIFCKNGEGLGNMGLKHAKWAMCVLFCTIHTACGPSKYNKMAIKLFLTFWLL